MYLSLHVYHKPSKIIFLIFIFLLHCPSLLYRVVLKCIFSCSWIRIGEDLNLLFKSCGNLKKKRFILPPVLWTHDCKALFTYKSLLNIQGNKPVTLEMIVGGKWDTASRFKYGFSFHLQYYSSCSCVKLVEKRYSWYDAMLEKFWG